MKPTNSPDDTSLSRQAQLIAEFWARRLPSFDEALALLRAEGLDVERLSPEDLHRLDMVHCGGVEATDLVAHEGGVRSGENLLDVGCGLGGPARRFAYRHAAKVCGIELSEPVFKTAVALTSLVGLADRVRFTLGSALKMPYEKGTFDVVVMQHCAMQVTEKLEIFGECARVLRTGGSLVLHEFFLGAGGEPRYPLAWATEPAMSALETFEDTEGLLSRLGFVVGPLLDQQPTAISFYAGLAAKLEKAIADGAGFRGKNVEEARNSLRIFSSMLSNFQENRVRLGIVVCRKSRA
jgi:ubiquinone/menaquinone biosynthesis C-methylase UbiE